MKGKKITKPDGNDFQYKVKKALTDAGWVVRMSPYYNDSFSEKPREIDIIAEKEFPPVQNSIYRSTVIVRLFVECKYIAESTTFWFESRNITKAGEVVDSTRSFHDMKMNHEVSIKHHYLSNELIAKLYRTNGKNSADGDPIYKAITQCLNATIYYRNRATELSGKFKGTHASAEELNYSVIVCNSFERFIKKDTTSESVADEEITTPFQLEVDYAYSTKDTQTEEFFYVDVLSIGDLKAFEENTMFQEVNLAKQKMSDDHRELEFRRMQSGSSRFDPYYQ